MNRVFNFSAGPSVLPLEVLEKAQSELITYNNTGMSVLEMSHRSKPFEEINENAQQSLKKLLNIGDDYSVLFVQGGASTQFACVPLNLMSTGKADYLNTGMWSKKAIQEAKKYGEVNVLASSEDKIFSYIPTDYEKNLNPSADYVHITTNNTIYGTHISNEYLPDTKNIPLVADMSSNFIGEVYDISKFSLIYAGAQKNVAPAGLTIVVIKNDLLGKAKSICPTMLDYSIHAKEKSLYNTPPAFCIYMAGLMFKWVEKLGGISEMEKINREKADMLYRFLDESRIFSATVNSPKDRSLMNIPFLLPSDELNEKFINEATKQGFVNLKGHRSVGGMRASIYNAMPIEGVKALVEFMKDFEVNNKI